jgi:tetratricopeptide (TPR) repeat protein
LLEVGSKIDRAFNEVNRAKQIRRNDPEDRITEVGLAPVYGTMGIAYEAIGKPDEALKRYEYQKQLDPMDVEPYVRIATLRKSHGQLDLAAVSLIQAMLLDSKQVQLWQDLNDLYGRLGQANAIVMEGSSPRLNIQGNAMSREHLIQAYRELIRTGLRTKRYAMAEDAWTTAVVKHRFPRGLFDSVFREPVDIVTPQGITGQMPPPASATPPP